jgi:hypothetical protein
MWLAGKKPNSQYWIDDLSEVSIKNADYILDVTSFIESGGNLKTASDLWSFSYLYQQGGLYCDTDAIAVKHFPEDEWILCSTNKSDPLEKLVIGVMKAPRGSEVYLNCINKIQSDWGNVTLFGDEYEKVFGHTDSTHEDKLFYPYSWQQWDTLFKNIEIPDVYSIHLYHTMLEQNAMVRDKDFYDKNTLIGKLIEKFDS